MKAFTCYITLAIVVFCTSCLSTRKLTEGNSSIGDNIGILDGTYENIPAGYSSEYFNILPLSDYIFHPYRDYSHYYKKEVDYSGKIRIKAVSDKKIQVDYIKGDSVLKSKILKGSMKNNFFTMRRKWRIIGIPVIFGIYEENKLAIGRSNSGFLQIHKGRDHVGGIIGMAGGMSSYDREYFARTDSLNVYDKTILLVKGLAKENLNIPVFFKTDIYSTCSYIWMRINNGLTAYNITVDGIEKKDINAERFSPVSIGLFKGKSPDYSSSKSSIVGYMENIGDSIQTHAISMRVKKRSNYYNVEISDEQIYMENTTDWTAVVNSFKQNNTN